MNHIFWFQHKYKAIEVTHGTADVYSTLTLEKLSDKVPVTLVLLKCKCGKLKTQTLKGYYTLKELNKNA